MTMPKLERNRQIGEMYAAGVPWPDIARHFSISDSRIHQLGKPWARQRAKAKSTAHRQFMQELLRMYAAGTPLPEIAEHFGISAAHVNNCVWSHPDSAELRAQRAKARAEHSQRVIQTLFADSGQIGFPERNQRIAKAYAAGVTLQQIGNRFGITRERVRQIINPDQRRQYRRELMRKRRGRSPRLTGQGVGD